MRLAAAALSVGLGMVAPASATQITPDTVGALLRERGAEFVQDTRRDGVPFFAFESDGYVSIIALYECTPGPCSRSMLYASFPDHKDVTLKAIGAWNRDNRHMRAYLADNGDPTIESDLVLTGASLQTVRVWLDLWRHQVPRFLAGIR